MLTRVSGACAASPWVQLRPRGLRDDLAGLPLPRDRNKTLTCLAGTEPVGIGPQRARRGGQGSRFVISASHSRS